jgi:hypothetical protein
MNDRAVEIGTEAAPRYLPYTPSRFNRPYPD